MGWAGPLQPGDHSWAYERQLCIALTATYAILCLASGIQTFRIVIYRHNLRSFQFAFHLLCFIWTALRVLFFASTTRWSTRYTLFVYWVPTDIQFATFSLMVVFYAYLLHKRVWEHKKWIVYTCFVGANLSMFTLTLGYIFLSYRGVSHIELAHHVFMAFQFLFLTLSYARYGRQLYYASGRTLARWTQIPFLSTRFVYITLFTLGIFFTRFVYNVITAFGIGTIAIGDVDGGPKYLNVVSFLLFVVWEILPTLMVLILFNNIPATRYTVWSCLCCTSPERRPGRVGLSSDAIMSPNSEQCDYNVIISPKLFYSRVSSPPQQPLLEDNRDLYNDLNRYDTDDDCEDVNNEAY